jgi:hypothetical protein
LSACGLIARSLVELSSGRGLPNVVEQDHTITRLSAARASLGPQGPKGWKFRDAILSPGLFAEIELPHPLLMGDYWYLFFSAKDYPDQPSRSVFR